MMLPGDVLICHLLPGPKGKKCPVARYGAYAVGPPMYNETGARGRISPGAQGADNFSAR